MTAAAAEGRTMAPEREVSLSVSDEMRRLFRAYRGGQSALPGPPASPPQAVQAGGTVDGAAEPQAGAVSDTAASNLPDRGPAGPTAGDPDCQPEAPGVPRCRPVVLRRDGQRPLCFEGVPLWSAEQTSAFGIRLAIRLFLDSQRTVVAALELQVPEPGPASPQPGTGTEEGAADLPLRPVFAASRIRSRSAFDGFVAGFDPAEALRVSAALADAGRLGHARNLMRLAHRLGRDLDLLVGAGRTASAAA